MNPHRLAHILDDLIEQARTTALACADFLFTTQEQRELAAVALDEARDRALKQLQEALRDVQADAQDRHAAQRAAALALEAGAPYLLPCSFDTTPNQLAALAACGVKTDPEP